MDPPVTSFIEYFERYLAKSIFSIYLYNTLDASWVSL